jgi:uncharacterized membrane protein YbhN (UPF0104 family)
VQFSLVSRPRMLPVLTLASLAGWGIQGLAPAIVLRDMGFGLGIRDSVFMFALATLIGGASFLPGGLGGFEVERKFGGTVMGEFARSLSPLCSF